MLLNLMRSLKTLFGMSIRDAQKFIEDRTETVYLCEPSETYNAALTFITGDTVKVKVTVLYKDK